jgi:hypothetical protein
MQGSKEVDYSQRQRSPSEHKDHPVQVNDQAEQREHQKEHHEWPQHVE